MKIFPARSSWKKIRRFAGRGRRRGGGGLDLNNRTKDSWKNEDIAFILMGFRSDNFIFFLLFFFFNISSSRFYFVDEYCFRLVLFFFFFFNTCDYEREF